MPVTTALMAFAVVHQAGEIAGRRGHGVLIMLLVLLLGALAMIAAVAWMAEHLAVLAGCVLLIAGAYYLGQQRRARPRQVQPRSAWPEEPAAASARASARAEQMRRSLP